jgi:hypothetical protein
MTLPVSLNFGDSIIWKIAIVLGAFVVLTFVFLAVTRIVLRGRGSGSPANRRRNPDSSVRSDEVREWRRVQI